MMTIERRAFLKGVGGFAAAASVGPFAFGGEPKKAVGVVGGGIVGASIALHLSGMGAHVTLFEKAAPASGATSKSFAWINAFTSDPHYRALRLKSIGAYHQLDQRHKLNITWGGSIHWAVNLAETERMKPSAAEFIQAGYDTRLIDEDELAALSPNLRLGPIKAAMFNGLDGHMDPVYVTNKMLDAAKHQGANIVHPCEVRELKFKGDRFAGVSTTAGDYVLDRLVIAGGVDTPKLSKQAGYTPPLKHSPGILLHTRPISSVLGRVVESPTTYFKQFPDGRIIGNDGYYAPDIPVHHDILQGPQEMPEEIRMMHGERILGKIKDKLHGADDAAFDHLTLGYRPMPQDRLPIVGFSPRHSDVYIAVMHSGVTLAAIMGCYISHEVMTNGLIDELAPYRPDRF